MVTVRVLGELALDSDGQPVEAPSSHRARSLLGWLATHPGLQPRSRVAGTLWPDVLEESARTSLRTTLATLKRELGAASGVVTATRDRVGIEPGEGATIDLGSFERLVAADELAEAAALSHGELLADLDDDWVHEPREQHRHALLGVLGRLADEAERTGDVGGALERTREQVALDPLSEEAQRELVRRLAAAGDRAAALAAYESYRERLARDLGIPPSAQTRELAEHVRRGGAQAEPGQPALPAMLSRPDPVPMVGRDTELRRLHEALGGLAEGGLAAVVVSGEPGSGKTRLAVEFARRAHDAGATIWAGRCYETSSVAYGPFVDALRGHVELERLPRWAAGELGRLLPELEPGSGSPEPEPGDPEAARLRLFEAVASVVAEASARAPLVLVVDDLQWADQSTLLMLSHVTRSASALRVLVLATAREREPEADGRGDRGLVSELARERRLVRVPLEGLGDDEVGELAASWLGEAPGPGLAEDLRRRTGGNAFFVEQLLRQAADEPTADVGLRVPAGVREAVGERVERLGRDTAEALAVAAAIGDEFGVREVGDVLGSPAADVVERFETALAASLVREVPGRAGRFRFAHDLVRETVYASMSAARRAVLHLELAGVFERLQDEGDDRVAEIARHLIQAGHAGELKRTAAYVGRAAEQALGRLAYEDAADLCERALELAGQSEATGAWRSQLLLTAGEAWLRAGDEDRARSRFADAANVARSVGEKEQLAHAALGFAGLAVTIAAPRPDVRDLLEEALAALPQDAPLRPRVLARLAIELYYETPRGRSVRFSEEALATARGVGGGALLDALNARHVALWGPDHLEERLEIAEELVERACALGDRERELQGRNWRILDLVEAGRLELVEDAVVAHERLAQELRLSSYSWYAYMWRALLVGLAGNLPEAEKLTAAGDAIARAAGDENARLLLQVQRLFWRYLSGALTTEDITASAERETMSAVPHVWHGGLALLEAARGNLEESRRWLETGVSNLDELPRDVNWLYTIMSLGVAAATIGDLSRTRSLYEIGLPYAHRNVVVGRATVLVNCAAQPLGVMADALGRRDEAERHMVAALERHRALGAPLYVKGTQDFLDLLAANKPLTLISR